MDIEKITGKRIYELFDLVAGASTGALIACASMLPDDTGTKPKHTLSVIENIFLNKGSDIFNNPRGTVGNRFLGAKYKPDALKAELVNMFDNYSVSKRKSKLSDLIRPVVVPAYDLKSNHPLVFKTRYARQNKETNANLVDVCLASAAAPTYFPGHQFKYSSKPALCIDGGIYMNNPALDALVEILDPQTSEFYRINRNLRHDIFLLSIGTGYYDGELVSEKVALQKGAEYKWAKPVTDIMMHAGSLSTDYKSLRTVRHANSLSTLEADSHYLRITMRIPNKKRTRMDDSSKATNEYLAEQFQKEYQENATIQKRLQKFLSDAENTLETAS